MIVRWLLALASCVVLSGLMLISLGLNQPILLP